MRPETLKLPLRIVMLSPPTGVAIAMQKGKGDLVPPTKTSDQGLVFDFEVNIALGPRLLGAFVQGPPSGRFVYINSGTYAGDRGSMWGRRAKVPLGGIDTAMIEALRFGERLEAAFVGKARDGGPVAASIKLVEPGWRAVQD